MPSKTKKIMLFGTFDIIHKGHLNLFKQARALAKTAEPFLIVSLARDKNVTRIKGKTPRSTEQQRLKQVAACSEVDKAILGNVNNYFAHIKKEQPDIIALGYDQSAYVDNLRQDLKIHGLKTKVIRLKPYKPHIYKTTLLKPR